MESIKISIKQKESLNPSIANIGKEIFEMYQLTIGQGINTELQLFTIYFFLKIKNNSKSLLETIFEENIDKLLKFDNALSSTGGDLSKGDYAELKDEYKVSNILKYDIIFLLIDCIINREEKKKRGQDILSVDDIIEIEKIKKIYGEKLGNFLGSFKEKKIKDDRYDDEGEYLDLSKSIYRPVFMRLSKTLGMPLQRETDFIQLTKNSPLALEFIQNIDIRFIFNLWQHLNLFDYIKNLDPETIKFVKEVAKGAMSHISFEVNIREIIVGLVGYYIGENKSKKEKKEDNNKFEQLERLMIRNNKEYKELLSIVKTTILNTDNTLAKRVLELESKINGYRSVNQTKEIKQKIKKLEKDLRKLKNLEFKIINN